MPQKAGVGIAVPLFILALLVLGLYLWHRRRKGTFGFLESENSANGGPEASNRQPYLQHKAELEDEARRKHELETQERGFELEHDSRASEMLDQMFDTTKTEPSPSQQIHHELSGEEHAMELGPPGCCVSLDG